MKEGKIGIYDIAEICHFHGVEKAILCPGSRCAPLTLAFSRTKDIECMSIVDERSAAFIALGIAETTQKPVVLICTSGSAVLNFGPALAEAFYRHIPLIVLTADRPQRLVGQHDGQTMNQPSVFANFIRESFSIVGDIQTDVELAFLHRTINAAAIRAKSAAGPVHVNISFEEPLYNLLASDAPARCISYVDSEKLLGESLRVALASHPKWMFLAGSRKFSEEENILLHRIGEKFPVIAESISNIHGNCIGNANEIMRVTSTDEKQSLVPDVLVTFGEGIISKNLKNFIRSNKTSRHIHIDVHGEVIDTFQSLTDVFAVDIKTVCHEILSIVDESTLKPEYLSEWKKKSEKTNEKLTEAISQAAYGDLKTMDFITRHLPSDAVIHVGNSMAVRYLNICSANLSHAQVYCNRGTSGIDGSISTAIGNAIGLDKPVWVIAGDLSFQYDGNALWNGFVPNNVKIIIINNSGGGIFRLIDGPSSVPELTERFETRTQSTAEYKAQQFGLGYFACHNIDEISRVWPNFESSSDRAQILEIFTDPMANETIFKTFQQKLSNTI